MKLYELTDEFRRLEEMADSIESSEDADAFSKLWQEIEVAFEVKAEKTACVIRNLESEADAIKEEEKRLASRRKALESSSGKLRDYVETHMTMNGLPKIQGKLFTLAIQKNPASLKLNTEELPDSWWVIKREPDNARVKEALKAGEVIHGAWLENGQSLRIK